MAQGLALEALPTSVLYDVFQDQAAALTGLYAQRQREAPDQAAADAWWAKVIAVRDQVRAVDPDDRDALIDSVHRWRREATDATS